MSRGNHSRQKSSALKEEDRFSVLQMRNKQEEATALAMTSREESRREKATNKITARDKWDPHGNYALFLADARKQPNKESVLLAFKKYFPNPDEYILKKLNKTYQEQDINEQKVLPIVLHSIEKYQRHKDSPENHNDLLEQYSIELDEYKKRPRPITQVKPSFFRRLKSSVGLGTKKRGKKRRKTIKRRH